jgi:DNA polymerase III sliding clamp (beta) subunit (PCNA family)
VKLNRVTLLSTLKAVAPALAAREVVEQSTSFVFAKGRVLTYNDSIAISHPLDSEGLEGVVRAEELVKLLSKLKEEEVELEIGENELVVKGKRSKAGILLEAEVRLPLDEIVPPSKWSQLPEGFVEALSFCRFSTGRDRAKPLLTCLHVAGPVVESCDNFRLTRWRLKRSLNEDLLLPAEAARTLCDYSPMEYGITDGWVHFRNDADVVFSSRIFEGEYPDLSPYLSLKEAHEVTLPSDLGEILDRAGIFSSEAFKQDEQVSISLEGKHMTVSGRGVVGWYEERCAVRWSGGTPKVAFSIHPEFLRQVLGHVKQVLVSDVEGRLLIEGDRFTHSITLLAEE